MKTDTLNSPQPASHGCRCGRQPRLVSSTGRAEAGKCGDSPDRPLAGARGYATDPLAASTTTLILVGNPNVGKSVLFSKLTGKFVVISNYPGTTVEISRGQTVLDGAPVSVVDTPGVNELVPRTEDARVTCDVLRAHPAATLIQVADAKNLRRALLLTQQLVALGQPLVLVLNMMDELDHCGGKIDVRALSDALGIPVIPTIATAGTGLHLLQSSIRRLVVERDFRARSVEKSSGPEGARSAIAPHLADLETRLAWANELLARCYQVTRPHHPTFLQKLGWWATQPVRGTLLGLAVLYVMFWFVGLVGAGTAVNFLEKEVFGRYVSPLAIRVVDAVFLFPHTHATQISTYQFQIPLTPTRGVTLWESSRGILAPAYSSAPGATPGGWTQMSGLAHDFLVGPYGLITMALSYALAIVLPIVTTFFLCFSLLEDSGYLSRLAVMVNRVFRAMGLNGKAVLPMVLGLGCDTMATMTTRILETRKERVVTTLLLALAVPCSAQLGVLLAMLVRISAAAALFWLALMIGVAFGVGWLAARLYGGATSDFIVELPPMRRPQLGNVWRKTVARLKWYLVEVIPLFILGTAILFVLDKLAWLERIARWGEPLVTGWLGLPRETAAAFLIGFLRRDYGAVYLLDAATGPTRSLNAHQVLVAMVTITLFMPCIATLFMIQRELGRRTAVWMTLFVFPFAFLMGGLVNRVGLWVGL